MLDIGDGTRNLMLESTHVGTRLGVRTIEAPDPWEDPRGGHMKGTSSAQIELVPGKKVYEVTYPGELIRLTRLVPA